MYKYYFLDDSLIRVKDNMIFEYYKDNNWIKEQSLLDLFIDDCYEEIDEKEALDIINSRRD